MCHTSKRARNYETVWTLTDMPIESIAKFTAPAAKLWASIPSNSKKLLLSNVWCGKCRHEVTITNFSGAVKAGDLLLVGLCSECRCDVARVIDCGNGLLLGEAVWKRTYYSDAVNGI
jgi:hypothetical protein